MAESNWKNIMKGGTTSYDSWYLRPNYAALLLLLELWEKNLYGDKLWWHRALIVAVASRVVVNDAYKTYSPPRGSLLNPLLNYYVHDRITGMIYGCNGRLYNPLSFSLINVREELVD